MGSNKPSEAGRKWGETSSRKDRGWMWMAHLWAEEEKWRWDAARRGRTSLPPASLSPWITPACPSLAAVSEKGAGAFTVALSQPRGALPSGYHEIIVFPEAGSPLTYEPHKSVLHTDLQKEPFKS